MRTLKHENVLEILIIMTKMRLIEFCIYVCDDLVDCGIV